MYQHYKGDKMNRCERRYRTQKIAKNVFKKFIAVIMGNLLNGFFVIRKKSKKNA